MRITPSGSVAAALTRSSARPTQAGGCHQAQAPARLTGCSSGPWQHGWLEASGGSSFAAAGRAAGCSSIQTGECIVPGQSRLHEGEQHYNLWLLYLLLLVEPPSQEFSVFEVSALVRVCVCILVGPTAARRFVPHPLSALAVQAGDTAMVMSLSGLTEVEDRNLLAGSLMVLLEQDVNQAQVCCAYIRQWHGVAAHQPQVQLAPSLSSKRTALPAQQLQLLLAAGSPPWQRC